MLFLCVIALAIAGLAGFAGFYVLTTPVALPPEALKPRYADIANGETMFNIGGCSSCHAIPKQDDRHKLGGGLALRSSFGTFKVPNISPDPIHGIGRWTELQFANALLKGTSPGSEHLYPSFPFTSYQRMTLNDTRDLFAFVKTLPPVAMASGPHELLFPFNIRRGIGVWKFLFVDGRQFTPDPSRDTVYNRGAYLVEGPGHCAECHSRRNILGGIVATTRFAGGPNPDGTGGFVPNITPHPDGLATWSVKDIEFFLETGFTPDGASITGNMADVVTNTAKLSLADRNTIAVYLKSLPPREGKKPPKK